MTGAAIGWRRALLLVALGALVFSLPALWRQLFVPSDRLPALTVARVVAEGAPPAIGPQNAATTIVFFTDARCPVCRGTETALAETLRAHPRVRLVVRDWPILGPGSVAAARAALAARDEPSYAAFRRRLTMLPVLDTPAIVGAAAHAGIGPARLRQLERVHEVAIDRLLDTNARLAGSLGLPGTPGLLVGDRLVKGGLDRWQLDSLISDAEEG